MKRVFLIMLFAFVMLFAGCNVNEGGSGTGELSEDQKTVDVKLYKAGYGSAWLEELIEKFEEMYSEEGYKINIYEASASVAGETSETEIKTLKSAIDLYFVGGVDMISMIEQSASILKTTEATLIEDLTSLFQSPAIGLDKKEESVTIESKMDEQLRQFYKFNGSFNASVDKWIGNYYAFPWANAPCGLFVNPNVLNEYDLDIPRTTDELLEQFEMILTEGAGSVYPMTYAGANAAGYWTYMFDTLFGQYSGVDAVSNFYKLVPETETVAEDGWKVYEDEGIFESLKVIEKLVNDKYCSSGTNSLSHTEAQYKVLNGTAAYIVTGNWVYNEMLANYSAYVDNIRMIKMPINSALGKKLGISDATLRAIVSGIDGGKDNATIAAEAAVDAKTVEVVREARSVYYNSGSGYHAIIPSYSPSKEVAKLFLRFIASDDGLEIYMKNTYSSLPFRFSTDREIFVNDFLSSVNEVLFSEGSKMVCEDIYTSPIRSVAKLRPFCAYTGYSEVFLGLSRGTYTAEEIYQADLDFARENWLAYSRQAGIR